MGDRKDFSQTELLKYLGQFTVNKARFKHRSLLGKNSRIFPLNLFEIIFWEEFET